MSKMMKDFWFQAFDSWELLYLLAEYDGYGFDKKTVAR